MYGPAIHTRMSNPSKLFKKSLKTAREEGLISLSREAWNFYYFSRLNPSYWRGQFKDELTVSVSDVSATFDTTSKTAKKWFYPRLIDNDFHEPGLTRRLLSALRNDSVFYDVGANVGYFTVLATEASKEGEVHAFEIDESLVNEIKSSLERNRTEAAVVEKAVSDTSHQTLEYVEGRVPEIDRENSGTSKVDTISIDDYIKNHSLPDVMKVDVEGFEHNVLEGCRQTFEKGYPKTLFLEIHPERLREHGGDKYQIISLLEEYNYDFYVFEDQWDRNSKLKAIDPESISDNTMVECRSSKKS